MVVTRDWLNQTKPRPPKKVFQQIITVPLTPLAGRLGGRAGGVHGLAGCGESRPPGLRPRPRTLTPHLSLW